MEAIRSAVAVVILAACALALSRAAMSYAEQRPDARVSVKGFGARGDARFAHDGSMTVGSPVLISKTLHFSPDDVGKPIYILNAGEAGAPLKSFVIAVPGPARANLANKAASSISETSVTIGFDDTAAVQNAITAIGKAGGGTVYIPAGVYRISSGLRLEYSHMRLMGDGPNSLLFESDLENRSTKRYAKTGSALGETLAGGWSPHRLVDVGIKNGIVRDVEIDHLQVESNGDKWVPDSLGQSLITTSPTAAFAVEAFSLHHVTFTSLNFGLYANGGRLNHFDISHNVMSEVAKEGIYLTGTGSNGIISDNNISTHIFPARSNVAIQVKNASAVQILDNTITGAFWGCIGVGGVGEWPEVNITIKNNTCSFSDSPNVANGIGFEHGTNISVVGNVITGYRAYGIRFFGPDSAISGIKITGNTIQKGRGGAAIAVAGQHDGPADVTITDNSLIDNESVGGIIELVNVKGHTTVTRNKIAASAQRHGEALVIRGSAGADLSCHGNTLANYKPGNTDCQ